MNKDSKFYNDLVKYVKEKDYNNANSVVMTELALLLAKNKPNFIEVIREANINVPDNATDIQLVNAFVDNAPSNRKLLLGASFLINHSHKTTGADGEEEVSDTGVKAVYKVMYDYFDASKHEDLSDQVNDDYYAATGEDEDFSNVGWAAAIKGIADVGGGITGKVMEGQQAKKMGSSMTLAKQMEARKQMTQTLIQQRQAQAEAKLKDKERKSKNIRTGLYIGGAVVVIGIIATVIYVIKKRKKSS